MKQTFALQELANFIGVSRQSLNKAKDKQKYLAKKGYLLHSIEDNPADKRSKLFTIEVVKSTTQASVDLTEFLINDLKLTPGSDIELVKALFKQLVLMVELDDFEKYKVSCASLPTIERYSFMFLEHGWIDDIVHSYYKVLFNGDETPTTSKTFQAWNIQLYVNKIDRRVVQQSFGCKNIYKDTTYLVSAFNSKIIELKKSM